MEGVLTEVVDGAGCCSKPRTKRSAKLVNYLLNLSDIKTNALLESVDLRSAKSISFSEDGEEVTISLGDREILLQSDNLKKWKNQLDVYNGREKQWSPIPMPTSYHRCTVKCLEHLMKCGTETEGLFRVAAIDADIAKLFQSLVADDVNLAPGTDPHLVAGTLKRLLRDMPETLLTNKFYSFLIESQPPPVASEVAESVRLLPAANRDLLNSLFELLITIAKNSAKTKMDMASLGICVNPQLGRKDKSIIENLKDSLQPLYVHYEKLHNYVPPNRHSEETPTPADVDRPNFPTTKGSPNGGLPPKKQSGLASGHKLPPKKKSGKGSLDMTATITTATGILDFQDLNNTEVGKGVPYHRQYSDDDTDDDHASRVHSKSGNTNPTSEGVSAVAAAAAASTDAAEARAVEAAGRADNTDVPMHVLECSTPDKNTPEEDSALLNGHVAVKVDIKDAGRQQGQEDANDTQAD